MLVGALVWPCPAPDPCTVSCPFLFSNCSAQPVRSAGVNQETCLHMCVCVSVHVCMSVHEVPENQGIQGPATG